MTVTIEVIIAELLEVALAHEIALQDLSRTLLPLLVNFAAQHADD